MRKYILFICTSVLSCIISAADYHCSDLTIRGKSYRYCPETLKFYAPFSKFNTQDCEYVDNSMKIIARNEKTVEPSLCVGFIMCGNNRKTGIKQRVACLATQGKCPFDPTSCANDSNVTIKPGQFIMDEEQNNVSLPQGDTSVTRE